MGKINEKDVKKLVKAAKRAFADRIEEYAIELVEQGKPVNFQVEEIVMDESNASAKSIEGLSRCVYICFLIGGTRICIEVCT